jgi:hypothetical protein
MEEAIPATNSSYSFLSLSYIWMRWSKKSGAGLSYMRLLVRYPFYDVTRAYTSSGALGSESVAFDFFSFLVFGPGAGGAG